MKVVPSILEKNPQDLFNTIKKLSPYFDTFQIDIADGVLVPNMTVQIEDLILTMEQFNNEMTKKLYFDFHLMVKKYEQSINQLNNLKIRCKSFEIENIFIHNSLLPNLQLLATSYPGFSFALVLNPEDSVNQLLTNYQMSIIDSIQIMSVHPGFQGSIFLPEVLKKIEQLRHKNYRNKIYLDGAVNQETLPTILSQKYKPDIICPGSFLTRAENLKERINYLQTTIKSA